jgi:4-amino-4-deoxy-L-arabinose transferase-like glycosyltransferase
MDWNKRFFLLLTLVTLFRLVYLLVAPLDLAADEAYYWDWSRQLDWGYFSKPPMIAWLIALFSRTIGSTTAVVRLPAVLLGAVSTLVLFLLGRRMYDSRTAFWAAAAGMASPGASALGFIMTIDAPLLCFWSIALYMFWAALESEKQGASTLLSAKARERNEQIIPAPASRPRRGKAAARFHPACSWEWFGLAAAIGMGLLSKQVMGAFIGLMFLFVAVSRDDRRLLKSHRLYLFSLLGLAALIPPLLWNAGHGWITLHHTAGHFVGSRSIFIATFAEFIGGQIAVVSPFTWILFALLSTVLLFNFRFLDRRVLYLLCFSSVPLIGVACLSLRQRIQPNWPAAVYPAGMILLAAWGSGTISVGTKLDSWRPYFKKGVIVGAAIALLTYGFPFWAGAADRLCAETVRIIKLTNAYPFRTDVAPAPWAGRLIARLQGWRQSGMEAGMVLGRVPHPEKTFILTFNRQLASELAFYAPGQPKVYNWRNPDCFPENQYDIWDGPKIGWDALIFFPGTDNRGIAALFGYFEEVERIDSPPLRGEGDRYYTLYLGTSLKKWPSRAVKSEQ